MQFMQRLDLWNEYVCMYVTFSLAWFLQILHSQEYMSIQESLKGPMENDCSLDHWPLKMKPPHNLKMSENEHPPHESLASLKM